MPSHVNHDVDVPSSPSSAGGPATPPNEKTGISYAQAAVKPPAGTTPQFGKSYADAIEQPVPLTTRRSSSMSSNNSDIPGTPSTADRDERRRRRRERRSQQEANGTVTPASPESIREEVRNEEPSTPSPRPKRTPEERERRRQRRMEREQREREERERLEREEREAQEQREKEEQQQREREEKSRRDREEKQRLAQRKAQEKREAEEKAKEKKAQEERAKQEEKARQQKEQEEKARREIQERQEREQKAQEEKARQLKEQEEMARRETKERREREQKEREEKEREQREREDKSRQYETVKQTTEDGESLERARAVKMREDVRSERGDTDVERDSSTERQEDEPQEKKKSEQKEQSTAPLVSALPRVRWAPLRIPLPRRLQTAAVLWHSFAIGILLSMFWFTLAIPFSWPILVPYLLYVLMSNSHADGSVAYRRSKFLRSLPLWRLYVDYFPIRLHRTTELDPEKNYIFAYHPHGIISHGAFGNFATEATGFSQLFPGITNTLLTLDTNFRVPFYRDYMLAMGLASVSRRSCEALLRGEGKPTRSITTLFNPRTWILPAARDQRPSEGGHAITIVVGGAREALEAFPGRLRLVMKRRRGFLKIAVKEGAGVVPVLSFGENDIYDQVVAGDRSLVHKLQMAIKKTMGFTLPLFHARGIFNYDVGFMPYRKEINTVVGRPLFPKQQNANPRDDEIDEFQARYIAELQRMWDGYKDTFAKDRLPGEEGELTIVE